MLFMQLTIKRVVLLTTEDVFSYGSSGCVDLAAMAWDRAWARNCLLIETVYSDCHLCGSHFKTQRYDIAKRFNENAWENKITIEALPPPSSEPKASSKIWPR